ncbi:LysR family transcriptional regulator [Lacicoccus qingdaonensis]|uniref:DNA-binding transcriptional regulator, LysR family n=1 Tax=Lacicoccus qingdaonensis TaxID=576118 RepID=A0A1G9DM03_9BACL|nr:LysR family transcriptional regulator [Salinicoccus qingdaonensis]SDK64921.1 DNA-binding transcriptional regulator, LysR family [Salinicoccus qingdaonensis]
MKVDDYKLLVTLNEAKTLRQAAERLFISQPAVSQRLKSIEEEWGVEIFVRTKRELFVTGAGERIISHAHKVVENETLLKEYLLAHEGSVEGNLNIGVSSLIGSTILARILREYTALYPDVNVNIQVGSSPQISNDAADYHISITRGRQILNKENEVLFTDRHYFVAPKSLAGRDDSPVIEFFSEPIYIRLIERYFEERFNKKYEPQFSVDQIATCQALLLEGVGVTVLPEIVVKDFDAELFNIEEALVDDQPITRDTYISYDKNVEALPQVKAFITVVRSYINNFEMKTD